MIRIPSLACILLLQTALSTQARAQLPLYEDWHPRLLVDSQVLAALPDSIAADPAKGDAWQIILLLADAIKDVPPANVLDDNAGLTNLPALGLVGHLAGEPLATQCRDKARETALYLAATEGVYGSGDDLTSVLRLHALLASYDLAFAGASTQERETVLAEIRSYLEAMTTDFTFRHGIYNPYCSNHSIALGAVLGLADLCLAGEWPDDPLLAGARSLGDSLIAKGVDDLLGDDGSYSEGGLYIGYIHRFLIPYWEAALRLENLTLWNEAKIAAAFEWVAYLLLPQGDGYFLNRNDCTENSRPLSRHNTLWEWGQRRLTDPRFARWVQAHISGPDGFNYNMSADQVAVILHHRRGAMLGPQAILPLSRYFPDQGLYVYRDSWLDAPVTDSFHFSIQAGTFRGGHWQEDVGQFTLSAFGHTFAMDHGAGVVAKQTEAHNLPLIAGLGQHNAGEGIGTDGRMSVHLDRGFCHALTADMEPAYSGHSPFNDPDYPVEGSDWSWGYDGGNPMERAERWVILFPPALPQDAPALYLLDDLRKDGQVQPMEWRLHFAEDLSLWADGDLYRISGEHGRLDARLLAPPAEETSWSLSTYDNANPDDESQVLSIHHSAADGRFLWQLLPRYPGQVEPPMTLTRFSGGVLATLGAAPFPRRDLYCAWQDSLQTPDAELHGRFAVYEELGQTARWALIAGREFWREGLLFFRLFPQGSASVDGPIVRLSDADLVFEIYAPEAVTVLAGDQPVDFVREGDYIHGGSLTSSPWQLPGGGDWASWSLRVREGGLGRFPILLSVRGPGAAFASLELFDVRGRRVARLFSGPLPAGEMSIRWSGEADGRRLAAGVYLARLAAAGRSTSAKLVLLH